MKLVELKVKRKHSDPVTKWMIHITAKNPHYTHYQWSRKWFSLLKYVVYHNNLYIRIYSSLTYLLWYLWYLLCFIMYLLWLLFPSLSFYLKSVVSLLYTYTCYIAYTIFAMIHCTKFYWKSAASHRHSWTLRHSIVTLSFIVCLFIFIYLSCWGYMVVPCCHALYNSWY